MRPKETDPGVELFECFVCGERTREADGRACLVCGGELRNISRARDL